MRKEAGIATMNVSLPQPLKRYVDGKVSSGVYGSASEFVREVIRERYTREQEKREAKSALEATLIEGLESGEPVEFTSEYVRKKKTALKKRLGRK